LLKKGGVKPMISVDKKALPPELPHKKITQIVEKKVDA
jgi:hypothetical protein